MLFGADAVAAELCPSRSTSAGRRPSVGGGAPPMAGRAGVDGAILDRMADRAQRSVVELARARDHELTRARPSAKVSNGDAARPSR